MIRIIILFVFLFASSTAHALQCAKTKEECIDNSTKIISGFSVTRCWNYKETYKCSSEDFTDYCTPLASTAGCIQTSSTCSKTNSYGACDTYTNIYTCGAKFNKTPTNTKFLSSNYTITSDVIDTSACAEPQNDPNCSLSSQTCTEGPKTKNINGLNVYRDCWKYDYKYSCTSGVKYDNCDDLNKNCTYQSKACIAEDSKGNCLTAERSYTCNKTDDSPATMVCQGQIYCINGDCQQASYTPDTGMAKGLTYMNLLKKAGGDFNKDTLKIFSGSGNSCSKAIGGYNNCCSDDGWGQDIGLASCSAGEKDLATKAVAGQCHYIGTYCSDETFFGVCLKKTKTYCCFGSKLGRIIQEQGRRQLGIGWGSAESPSCTGLTTDQLKGLDFSKIDLSDMYNDMVKSVSVPEEQNIIDSISDKIERYYEK